MRKVLKWIGIVLGVLIGLFVIVVAVFAAIGYRKLTDSQQFNVTETFSAPTSPDAVARGQYLVNSTEAASAATAMAPRAPYSSAGRQSAYWWRRT